ncbi:hypothetical protein EPVG_00433 [Emiliania huxleyi virus 201]|nr:hypothetical protein ELVG_00417 [Emiliania huxleyi virus 203]AEP15807.1 hypothetical protein EQVG_00398 [Emiliania huxleyi virus 207]AEP16190.1 hypothetical protein ERVG_00315 [Emiliania huxleyi virus 208]AET98320.1 hypothetical protein EPVG_00433 [Emiliania huxleyi virus 201]
MSDTNVKPLSIIIKNRTKKMKLSDEYMAKMKILRDGVIGVYVISDRQKFRATTGKKENGVYTCEYFPLTESGFEAAFKASNDYREKQDEERKRKENRTPNEKRDENIETHGDNSALERDFLISLKPVFEGSDINYLILNDGTNADNAFKFVNDSMWLPIQTKTTRTYDRGNSMQFSGCSNYTCIMLCWNVDAQRGVFLDGAKVNSNHLNFTFKNVEKQDYFISHVNIGNIKDVVGILLHDTSKPRFSEIFLRWQLDSADNVKEMVDIQYLIKTENCTFPNEQNSHVDLCSGPVRRQLKTCRVLPNQTGLLFNTTTNIGMTNGKCTTGPYPLLEDGSPPFDILDVFFIENGTLHHWSFPVDCLLGGSENVEYETKTSIFTQNFPSIFSHKEDGRMVGGCTGGMVYLPEKPGIALKFKEGSRTQRSWAFKQSFYKTSVKLSSVLDDTLLSEMPENTQKIVRDLMKTE